MILGYAIKVFAKVSLSYSGIDPRVVVLGYANKVFAKVTLLYLALILELWYWDMLIKSLLR